MAVVQADAVRRHGLLSRSHGLLGFEGSLLKSLLLLFLGFLQLQLDAFRVFQGIGNLLFPFLDGRENVFEGKPVNDVCDNDEVNALSNQHWHIYAECFDYA